ncbi:GL11456 [Drosophila persimilis]|uniref:GL11456 n=1 Tax=Drosophila persimilis TaxID=7234 RepID=B4GAX5_DROPE|nr:GL11456 [Drosophila persimilis]
MNSKRLVVDFRGDLARAGVVGWDGRTFGTDGTRGRIGDLVLKVGRIVGRTYGRVGKSLVGIRDQIRNVRVVRMAVVGDFVVLMPGIARLAVVATGDLLVVRTG